LLRRPGARSTHPSVETDSSRQFLVLWRAGGGAAPALRGLAHGPDQLPLGRLLVTRGELPLLGADRAGADDLRGAVEQLAQGLAATIPAGRTMTVAVADFPDLQGVTSDLGRYAAERLVTRLSARPAQFSVIERRRLDQVLGELRFGLTDLVDPAKFKQLRKMIGVNAIVVGTISDLGTSVDIDARIIEIETSRTFPGVSVSLSKDDTVKQLLDRGRAMPATSAGATASRAAPASGSHSLPLDDLPELRVAVEALQRTSNNRLLVWLRLSNKTREHLGVGLDSGKAWWLNQYPTLVVDDNGNEYRLQETSGFNDVRLIPPAGEITVALTFASSSASSKASSYSLSSELALYQTDGDSLKEVQGKHVLRKTLNVSLRSISRAR
jgi:TolB-like protein